VHRVDGSASWCPIQALDASLQCVLADSPHACSTSQLIGLKAKLYAKKRHAEKVVMKRTIAQHSERTNKHKADDEAPAGAVPHYLLDREQVRGVEPRVRG
jgi:hypothetical protein